MKNIIYWFNFFALVFISMHITKTVINDYRQRKQVNKEIYNLLSTTSSKSFSNDIKIFLLKNKSITFKQIDSIKLESDRKRSEFINEIIELK